jgi:hypothetical protein
VAKRRQELTQAEAKLKDALKRFEAQQEKKAIEAQPNPWVNPPRRTTKPPADRRLEDVEKKLEQLLKEVEKLRKDLRPGKGTSSSSRRSEARYVRTREFAIPVSWNPGTTARKAQLFVTTDGGQNYTVAGTYALHRESGRVTSISYRAPYDGEFGFVLATENPFGQIAGPSGGQEPTVRVIVDTLPPNVVMSSERDEAGTVKLTWNVKDANLDPDTMRLAYRLGDEKEWKEVSKPLAAEGSCVLRPAANSWEIRMRATDRAGNVGEATLRHPERP